MKTLLAFDLGTSGVKCSLYTESGELLWARYGEYETQFPQPDFRQQCPADWIQQIQAVCRTLLQEQPEAEICGIGISGHSLGALPVDVHGQLLVDAVPIWSDARARQQADVFFEKVNYRQWYETTGNGFPAELYSLFKILWYKDNQPEIYEKTYKFIGTKDYVNAYLTGQIVTDISYATGCGLVDLMSGRYCEEYAKIAGVDLNKMPDIYPSHTIIGYVTKQAAEQLHIPVGIPVVAGGVDNACMALGAGCYEEGDAYASLGSSAWVTISADRPVVDCETKIYTFAHCVPGKYIPSLGIFASGSALAWAAKNWFPDIQGEDRYDVLGSMAQKAGVGAHGLLFNPCLAGGSSADKSPNIRGNLFNLELGHTREDIARAVFEGIAFHLYTTTEPLLQSGQIGERLLVVGGGAKGEVARQIYADVFAMDVAVSKVRQDTASLGAAVLAAVGCGLWDSFDRVKEIHKEQTISHPRMENHVYYEKIMPIYRRVCDACSDLGDAIASLRK